MTLDLRDRCRHLLRPSSARRRRRLAAVALVAAACAIVGLRSLSGSPADRSAFGPMRRAPVARTNLSVGTVITPAMIEWRELPADLVTGDIPDRPDGRVVIAPILAGEVVNAHRLAGDGVDGLAAITPRGGRAITIARDDTTPAVRAGERVELFGPDRRSGASVQVVRVARDAIVLAVTDRGVTVGVREVDVAETARAALDGAVIIAVIGPG